MTTNKRQSGAYDNLHELFVLGMIARRPMYGHGIMRTLSVANARAWIEISDKHIYHVLRRLEQRGLVTGTEERDERRPPRRRFELTTPGREAFEAMIRNEAHQHALAYSPFDTVIAMLAWSCTDGPLALELLRRRRAVLAEKLAEEHPASLCTMIEARFGRIPRAMFTKTRVLIAAELRWLDALIEEASRLGWAEMRVHENALEPGEKAGKEASRPRAARGRSTPTHSRRRRLS